MNVLVNAIRDEKANTMTRTENGMRTNVSAGDACVDLFNRIGSGRVGRNRVDFTGEFIAAMVEDEDVAVRILQWARDVRGGAGERATFRSILAYLDKNTPSIAERLIVKVPEIGRWDDLLAYTNPANQSAAFDMWKIAIQSGNALAAKWAPRKGAEALKLRSAWGMTPKQYRRFIVDATNVVETKMCANQWTEIEYDKVPSLAGIRHRNAFQRHDPKGYDAFARKLETGEAKINAGAVYPHDIVRQVVNGNSDNRTLDAMWKALPNYMTDAKVLPVVDVSGSMGYLGSPTPCPMQVAVALGLYCSDKNTGPFKDVFMTFSGSPAFVTVKGTLSQKIDQMSQADWAMNTNLNKVFDKLLTTAIRNRATEDDMPTTILIMSDMQFDACVRYDDTALQMIRRKYNDAGYELPNVVFWNLNATYGGSAAKSNSKGVALVSGYSPAIMTSLLADIRNFTPKGVMLQTVMNPRYDW